MNLVWMRKFSLVSATFSYPPQPRHFHGCSMLSENIPSSRAFTAFTLTGVVFTPNTGNVNVSLENPCMQLEWLLFWTFKSHNTTAELEIRSESCKWMGELGVWDAKFKLTLEKPRNDNFLICVVSFDDCDGLPESLMTTNALSSCHTQSNHWVLLGISKNSHTRVRRSIITHSQNSTYFSTPIFSTLFPLVVFTVITIAKLTANWTANCSSRTFLNYFFFPTSLSCGRYVSCAAVWFSIFHLFSTHIEHFSLGRAVDLYTGVKYWYQILIKHRRAPKWLRELLVSCSAGDFTCAKNTLVFGLLFGGATRSGTSSALIAVVLEWWKVINKNLSFWYRTEIAESLILIPYRMLCYFVFVEIFSHTYQQHK